ncbi:Gfo/Idh/MocA family oxidoreductase [Paenibacillus sp. J5C_2022]|uniref:Gfo/Idh/MocA family oxidoreductase n=1 Tax=Paenibacillus sp. J5C2022 TaxID=2977129 RepID=UPI0021CFE1E4|nr:Gfo/Idh/MocA family oxidoreductase [Paenibacillus sp. J5C2022]MCU6712945.1 Gfo/Idh/MocA family oxidoreductase [Paenibacillus sp. J5C2022]
MTASRECDIKPLRIGMIGLDTSHVTEFAKLLHDETHRYHVPGGRIAAAYRGGSPDVPLSCKRIDGFTSELQQRYTVPLVETLEEVADRCDVLMLESVDARRHLEQFRRIAPFGKPVFIDKPFAASSADAADLAAVAQQYGTPIMSASALRFADGLERALLNTEHGPIVGVDCYGPMPLEPSMPGFFWYGVHMVEMIYCVMGEGCAQVSALMSRDHDIAAGRWKDGRIAVLRGCRSGNCRFGGMIHREYGSDIIIYASPKPYFASLLERVMDWFRTGRSAVALSETLETIRFIEAANKSRLSGLTVNLNWK